MLFIYLTQKRREKIKKALACQAEVIKQMDLTPFTLFEIVAEYQWSFIKKQWIGPKGSPQKGFIVVEGDAKETAKELLKSKAEQDSPADTAKSRR